jgi:hypothetical protein
MTYNRSPHSYRKKSKIQSLAYSHFVYPKSLVAPSHRAERIRTNPVFTLSKFLFHPFVITISVAPLRKTFAEKLQYQARLQRQIFLSDFHVSAILKKNLTELAFSNAKMRITA